MAEEPPKSAKKEKKALPDIPAEPEEGVELPTAHEIRAARKAELVAWCEAFGLDASGKVDDLRARLLDHVAATAKEAPAPPAEGEEEGAEAEEEAPEEAPPKKPTRRLRRAPKEAPAKKEEEPEEEEYTPRIKPSLDDRTRRLLALRAATSAARPAFHRQEWFRYRKFGDEWRKPQGGQSKLRRHFGYRWNLPSIGYRGPREVRGAHPSGFREVLIHNMRQLEGLDPTKQAVRVAHGVGARKRELIEKACDEKGLRILNRTVTR